MTLRDGSNFIYCIRSDKTSISAMSVVGIYIYIPSTLPDRRKANPAFTNSPFKRCPSLQRFKMHEFKNNVNGLKIKMH